MLDTTSSAPAPTGTRPAADPARFLDELRAIVGAPYVLTDDRSTERYRTGFRFGFGRAVAVVRPANLVEQWRLVQACVAHDKIVIMQAANTGLTGGSTPDRDGYDRDIVVISTLRMKKVQLIREGRQVICFPGSTLDQLEQTLRTVGREPHSVIGSSCIGASVFGGVCNNSGGSLVQRGPAYTEMSVFARLTAEGRLELVNHLGVRLGDEPEEILRRLDAQAYGEADIDDNAGRGSDAGYAAHVRDVDADTPARFNADPQRLYEASGSAGKLILFAVRLDTFPAEKDTAVFYLGTNDPDVLTEVRRDMLAEFPTLPIAGEYMHRTAFDIADKYGKDTFLTIRKLGTAWVPKLYAMKARVDAIAARVGVLPTYFSDRLLQWASGLLPDHLPKRLREYRDRYEHHLMIKVSGSLAQTTEDYLKECFGQREGAYFRCSAQEGSSAFLLRFAAAGAAVRYRAVHHQEVEDIVALDIALRRNDRDWLETLPAEVERPILRKMYYGHFFCYVFHQDYIVAKGHDCLALEHQMWDLLDARGAEYPAEHNVGHLYPAKPALRGFYRSLDPCNQFNPGIGQTTKRRGWAETL